MRQQSVSFEENIPLPKKVNILYLLLLQLRPKQWTKNLLLFAALLFSIDAMNLSNIFNSIIGFVIFCMISGCVYILNDFVDIDADRKHSTKKHRPMASGLLKPSIALTTGGILLIGSLICSYYLNPLYTVVLIAYLIMNIAYTLRLKHMVIIDLMIIAAGFVLRAIAGGLVIHVPFTPWFLMCTMLLSLFLAICKRRHEYISLQNNRVSHRKVLEKYSIELLDQLISIVTAATIISYSLFTFTSDNSIHLMWTIPIVIYGVFRYLYLIHIEKSGGSPERVLLEDKHILFTVIIYVISVIVILGLFQ